MLVGKIEYFIKDFWTYIAANIFFATGIFLLIFKIFKKQTSQNKKIIIFSFLLTIILFIFTFTAFEFYFRYVYDEPDGLGFLKVSKKWNERHVVYNNFQFRDRDFNENKEEGTIRIAVVGDSITFGGGIENIEDRFSNLLEKKLKNSGKNVEVYNLGKPGHDTQAEIEFFQKLEKLNFDLIVWAYYLNDIQPAEKSTGTSIIASNSKKTKIIETVSNRSYFLDFMYWRISQKYQKTFNELKNADLAQYENQNLYNSHKESLKNFISDQKKIERNIFFIIFPLIHILGANYPAEDIHLDLKENLEAYGAPTIDLLPTFTKYGAKNLMASKFDSHPNELAHAIAADELYKVLSPLIK